MLIDKLPAEIIQLIMKYLSIDSLCTLQQTSSAWYNFIMQDRQFMYFNTLKFFKLYYYNRLFAPFLLPFVNPRYSFRPLDPKDLQKYVGNTIFHIVVTNGLIERVQSLCDHHDKPVPVMQSNSSFYNHQISNHLYLIESNRQCRLVELVNNEPNTALHFISILPEVCTEEQTLGMASHLLSVSNLWTRSRAGNTILCEAAQHGQLPMVQLILDRARQQLTSSEFGLFVNMKNDFDENAAILASRSNIETLKALLEAGADPDSSRSGQSLLHIVCSDFGLDRQSSFEFRRYHRERIVTWGRGYPRLTHQADFLGSASDVECDTLMELLIAYGADINRAEKETGMLPIQIASFWGNVSAIKILHRHQADISAENTRTRWTAMHYACSEVQVFAIQTLLSLGARLFDRIDGHDDGADENSLVTLPPPALELLNHDVVRSKVRKLAKMFQK